MGEKELFEKALEFVKERHAGQVRAGDVPVSHHLARVSNTLSYILETYKEGGKAERLTIARAALGHDILEDTKTTEAEVLEAFGERGLEIIIGMTNRGGDKNTGPYRERMAKAEEAVRLVKCADLIDNLTSAAYNLHLLGIPWLYDYFLPIVLPMERTIQKTSFSLYPKTGQALLQLVSHAKTLLMNEVESTARDKNITLPATP